MTMLNAMSAYTIFLVESLMRLYRPAVYIAESVISSRIEASSSILLQVGKNSPSPIQIVEYSGPSLSYYINKLKPMKVVQTSVIETPTASEVYGLQALVAAPEIEALNAPKIEAINATEVEFSKPEAPAPQVELLVSVGGDDGILREQRLFVQVAG
ncbi:hypothetical protein KY290_025050 [Solanum tuberosum]|uniref:Uncharacterized protein n=1 Tax=Solanum tuberosum TaxID=4113 RepID=A0ABQ7UVK4_SOLTU|nr:hypothetical protein KY290_025050 [Solanum tuberosum]